MSVAITVKPSHECRHHSKALIKGLPSQQTPQMSVTPFGTPALTLVLQATLQQQSPPVSKRAFSHEKQGDTFAQNLDAPQKQYPHTYNVM